MIFTSEKKKNQSDSTEKVIRSSADEKVIINSEISTTVNTHEASPVESSSSVEELEKKAKGLKKRLKQIEELKKNRDLGCVLNEDQVIL